MARLLAWISIALLSVYLVFFGGGWAGIYRAELRLISVLLAGAALAVWGVVAWRRPEWRPRSALLPAIGLALASLAISTATSRFPRQSIEYLGYAVILAALYLLLVQLLSRPFFRARMGTLAVALAIVLGTAYAAANLSHWLDWWRLIGRVAVPPLRPESESLTFGNPSTALTIVLLFATSAFAVIGAGSRARVVVLAGIGALAAFATLVSGSRAGWLAIAITTVVMAVLYLADAGRRRGLLDRLARWLQDARARVALAVAGVAGVAALVVLAPVIVRRITDGGEDLRISFVVVAGRLFGESPIVGTGPGTWVIQRIRYTQPPEVDYYIPHAHNIYAQTAAELGVVGILAGLFLVGSIGALVLRGLRDDDPLRRRWGWAAAVAMVYFATHQLLDFYANMSAILFAAALPVAWLDATSERGLAIRGTALPDRLGRIPSVVATAAVAIAVGGMAWTEIPALQASRAADLANAGDWGPADEAARNALQLDPSWAPYQMTMAITAANVGDHARAAGAFRDVATATDLPEAWVDLAAEEALLGHDQAARDAVQRAARLGLQREATAMAIGELAERLGDLELSDEAYVAALRLAPSLAADPWWATDPRRESRFREIVNGAIAAIGPADAWQIALMTGDADFARGLLVGDAAAASSLESQVIDAWTGDEAALQSILDRCRAEPLSFAALGWAARLEARRGDVEAANRYRRWAYAGSSGALSAGAEHRVSDAPLKGRTQAGELAEFWGPYTYRRWTPWNLLVPSLVQLTLE